MAPLLVLIVVFILCRLSGFAGMTLFTDWRLCLRIALAAMFLLTASAHWGKRRADLVRMVPPSFSQPAMWVTLTGIAEIAGALGLLWAPALRAASVGLTILLLAVFPANIHAAHEKLTIAGRQVPGLPLRTLIQIVFLSAVIAVGWF